MLIHFALNLVRKRFIQFTVAIFILVIGTNSSWGQCEIQKLLASKGDSQDRFGIDMKLVKEMLFVGSSIYDGLNEIDAGAVLVFHRDGSEWAEDTVLTALDGVAGESFGLSLDLGNDIIIVGAPGVDGKVPVQNIGAAYVFRFDPDKSAWTQEAKLQAPDAEHADLLGRSVGISGNVAIAGAHGDDDNGQSSGSAYVFTFDGAKWSDPIKLLASDGAEEDVFGFSVDIDGDVIVVGAPFKNGIDSWSGAVYIFRFNPKTQTWDEEAKLIPSDTALLDIFGHSVSIFGNDVLIGATQFASGRPGKAYIFHYDGENWIETIRFTDTNGGENDLFGHRVDLADGVAIIGAPEHDAAGEDSGAAYVYKFDPETSTWRFLEKFTASDAIEGEQLGFAVAASQTLVAAGAIFDDDLGENSGSAYIFDLVNKNCDPDSCPGDLDGNGIVGTSDLLELFTQWGAPGTADLNADCTVNTADLLLLFSNWGDCP